MLASFIIIMEKKIAEVPDLMKSIHGVAEPPVRYFEFWCRTLSTVPIAHHHFPEGCPRAGCCGISLLRIL